MALEYDLAVYKHGLFLFHHWPLEQEPEWRTIQSTRGPPQQVELHKMPIKSYSRHTAFEKMLIL